jgi:hypothetical protein
VFEIGNSLREARVRQGLEYPQVELATKIRAKYVKALEEEQFGVLPAQPYVKGFLRTYAEFLGLDGQLYVDEYNSRFVSDGFDEVPAKKLSPHVRQQRSVERRVVLFTLVGIAVLTAGVIVAWKFGAAGPATPSAVTQTTPIVPLGPELRITTFGKGTKVEVRRGSASGSFLLGATVVPSQPFIQHGARFWIFLARPSRSRVTLAGHRVKLPSARRNLCVIVTSPARATRVACA